MQLKLLQININEFQFFDELVDYIQCENPDIITMQEVTKGAYKREKGADYIEQLAKKTGYNYVFGPKFRVPGVDGNLAERGNMILSKCTILDYYIHFVPEFGSINTSTREELGLEKNVSIPEERTDVWMREQGMPSNIVSALLDIDGKLLRIMSSHFPASPKCTETYVMNLHAQYLVELLGSVPNDIPVIFAGDLNIQRGSSVCRKIESKLTPAVKEHQNTLNHHIHVGFKNDIPKEGFHIDHVYYTGVTLLNWKVEDITISDHFPVICEFELS